MTSKPGKAGFPCPECSEIASLSSSTSSFRTRRWVIRGRLCPNNHSFTTMEAAIDNLEWFELRQLLEAAMSEERI